MKRLDPDNSLFNELASQNPPWWQTLKEDDEIYIDVRKGNEIDAYYNGGALLRKLRHHGSQFYGEVHYKYLLPEKAKYIRFDFNNSELSLKQKSIDLTQWERFKDVLYRVKANMRRHYPANSEKGIQARFVLNSPRFIDTELENIFQHKGKEVKARIDLTWIDRRNKLIIPTELKTIADSRVYNDDIAEQLEKYADFIKQYSSEVKDYYVRLFEIKRRLGLLPNGLGNVSSLSEYKVCDLPLLIFGDCNQLWIDKISPELDRRISHCAVGTYYFGDTKDRDCGLLSKTNRNKHIY